MSDKKRSNYKNSQEYIRLQSEIARLNDKLKDLYEKKRRIKLYDDKMSKINKIYLLILVSFEILAFLLTKGVLLIIQSFVVTGLSLIGFTSSRKVYDEEKKLKADNAQIDIEIENTEAELKIAKGNLNEYVRKQQNTEDMSFGKTKGKSKSNTKDVVEQNFDIVYPDNEEKEETRDKSGYSRVRTLEKNDNNN